MKASQKAKAALLLVFAGIWMLDQSTVMAQEEAISSDDPVETVVVGPEIAVVKKITQETPSLRPAIHAQ